jgi:hypothetical protein
MKKCQKCNSDRVADVYGKCSDLCTVEYKGYEHEGYVPTGIGVGGNDDLQFKYCLDCGQIQGKFPLAAASLEKARTRFLEKQENEKRKMEERLDANKNFDMEKFFNS